MPLRATSKSTMMFAERSKWRPMLQIDDHFLDSLVEFAERGLKLPIIVSVGGATIQGRLISEDEYFKRLSELVYAKSPPSPNKPRI